MSRELKLPPRMLFITRTGKMSGALEATPSSPIQICDCGAPGLSTSVTTRAPRFAPAGLRARGASLSFHSPNRFSKRGISAPSLVSPTTKSAALEGRNQALCQATRSLREIDFTDLTVPSSGYPQGCFSP